MHKLSIVPMEESQLDPIHTIERACFTDAWSRNAFLSDIRYDKGVCLTALWDSRVAGYLMAVIVLDECSLNNIAVDPSCRRKGVARALLDRLLAICRERGCASVTLEVRESNFAAQSLYLSYGFEQVGRRERYYTSPSEAAVLMTKNLDRREEAGGYIERGGK